MTAEKVVIDLLRSNPETSVCRLCLDEDDGDFVSMFETQGRNTNFDKLKIILPLDFNVDEFLPSNICKPCCVDLVMVDNFITKWKNVQNTLVKIYLPLNECSDDKRELMLQNSSIKGEENVDESEIQVKVEFSDDKSLDDEDFKVDSLEEYPEYSLNKPKSTAKTKDRNDCEDWSIQNKNICHLCNKQLKYKTSLIRHIEHMHGEARFSKVGKVTGFGSERRYHCMYCDYKAKNTRTLNCHIRVHTGEKPFKCELCDRYFTSYAGLYQHKNVHSNVMNFTCSQCGKQFNSKRKHERHQMVHVHEKKFICDICNKPLKNKKSLEVHLQRHNNIKNYSCETCGATFVSCSELIGHSKTHDTVKRFHCNICKFSSNVKAHLEVHLRRHSGLRPYECNLCPVKCYTKSILKVHMRTHTKEKNYPCSVCDKRFSYSSALNKHVLRCHGVKYKWSDEVDRRVIK